MKNKKFLKALAAITLSASAAVGVFGLTACGGGNGGHEHDYQWENGLVNQHYKICKEDGTIDESTRGEHEYVNGTCVCGRTEQGQGTVDPGPGGPGTGNEDPDDPQPTPDDSVEIYKNDFTQDQTFTLADEAETEIPEKGIYGTLTQDHALNADAATNLTLSIAEGKLQLKDTGKGTVNAYIKIDPVELKKVTVTAEVTPGSENGGWNLLTFLDANGAKIANIRSNKDKKVGLSLDGTNTTGSTVACSGTIKVEAVLDLVAGTIDVTLNGSAKGSGTITAKSFGGVSLMTANGSKDTDTRNISLNSLVVTAGSTSLDAEGLKTNLTAKYEAMGVDTNYTTNGAQLTKAYEDGLAAITAAADQKAAVKAFSDAVAALDAVESDAQLAAKQAAYEKAKTDAVAELRAYKGGAANYNEAGEGGNKTAYDAAIADATTAINGVALNNDLDAAKAAINEALAAGKTAVDGISDNATLRAAARETAKTEIANYKADEIDEIINATVKAAIEKVKTDFPAKVDAAVTLANIKAAVNTAKASIDGQIDSLHLDLDGHKADKKGDLADYATAVKADLDATADATLISTIDGIVTRANTAIDAVTEGEGGEDAAKVEVSNIYDEAISAIDEAIAAYGLESSKNAAKEELIEYANKAEVQQPINQDQNLINELIAYATNDTTLIGKIEAAENTNDLDTAIAECKEKINEKVTELSNHEYTITVSGASVTVAKVKYGGKIIKPANPADEEDQRFVKWCTDATYATEFDFENTVIYSDITIYAQWRVSDVTITYIVDGETWKEVPAFSGETFTLASGDGIVVSGKTFDYWYLEGGDENTHYSPSTLVAGENITLIAKLKDKTNEDLVLNDSWTVSSDVTSGTIADADLLIGNSKLFTVTAPSGAAYIKNGDTQGSKTFGGVTISGTKYDYAVVVGQIGAGLNNEEAPIVITAKEDLKNVKVYLKVAGDNGSDNRNGNTYYTINDGTEEEVTGFGEIVIEDLEVGDVIKVYVESTETKNGGKLYLGEVKAEIADTFTNSTIITVVDGVETEIGWNSLKPVTAPAAPVVDGKSFKWWSATDGGEAYNFGSQIDAGSTLKLYAVFATADVTVNFYDEDGSDIKVGIGAVSGSPLKAENIPADPKKAGYNFVGWYEKTDGEYNATAYDFTTDLAANSTLNLYAKYEEILPEIKTLGFTNTQIDAALITKINGQRADETKFLDDYGILRIVYDKDVSLASYSKGGFNYVKFGGQLGTNARHIIIDLRKYEGTAELSLGAFSSNADRNLFVSEEITKTATDDCVTTVKNELVIETFTLDCGKIYYICADNTVELGELNITLDVNALK